jgi:Methylamine utilisation protein MauE
MLDPVAAIAVSLGGALLFAGAAIHKLRAAREFVTTVAAYQLAPLPLVNPIAWSLPIFECGVAAGLIWPPLRQPAALLGAALLLSYGAAIAINLGRGRRDLDCGCSAFGERRPVAPWMVIRNLLIAAALLLLLAPISVRPVSGVDIFTIGTCLTAATLLYLSLDLLLGKIAPRSAAWNSRP